MTDLAVDVLIPTRNRARLTARVVDSALAQTHMDLHVYVADDGSSAPEMSLLQSLIGTDPRVTVLRTAVPGGPAVARQRAFDAGGAPWVAPLDSDDEWHPTKVERQLGRLQQVGGEIALCWFEWVRPDGSVRIVRRPTGEGHVSPGLTNNIDVPLATRQLVRSIGGFVGDEHSPRFCDEHLDFMVRLLAAGRVTTVEEVLVTCHDHAADRASDNASTDVESLGAVLKARAPLFADHLDDLAGLRARYSARLLAAGRRKEGWVELSRALREARSTRRRFEIMMEFGPHAAKATVRP